MGRFIYHRTNVFELDDRLLSHVQAVVTTKLRRGEPFMATISVEQIHGGGRFTLWVNKASDLVFKYRRDPTRLNPAWMELLLSAANSPGGLHMLPEPAADGAKPARSA
jgi:hypothetical protein